MKKQPWLAALGAVLLVGLSSCSSSPAPGSIEAHVKVNGPMPSNPGLNTRIIPVQVDLDNGSNHVVARQSINDAALLAGTSFEFSNLKPGDYTVDVLGLNCTQQVTVQTRQVTQLTVMCR